MYAYGLLNCHRYTEIGQECREEADTPPELKMEAWIQPEYAICQSTHGTIDSEDTIVLFILGSHDHRGSSCPAITNGFALYAWQI